MMDKGIFITIEGIDGCGKSTQARLLCSWLENALGKDAVLGTFEPGGWKGGAILRALLLGETALSSKTELLLFLADRSGHIDAVIAPALRGGLCVVCERYTDSTLAYQSQGRGVSLEETLLWMDWCRFPVPDLTILLDVNEGTAKSRLGPQRKLDRIESAGDGFMARVAAGYRELAALYSGRIEVVDAAQDVESVAASARLAVKNRLPSLFSGKSFQVKKENKKGK